MEHLSRRTTHKVNVLLIVSDPTVRGIKTIKRIEELVDELKLEVERKVLIINRVTGEEGAELTNMAQKMGLNVAGLIPNDHDVFKNDLEGKSIFYLSPDSITVIAAYSIFDSLKIP
jgi:CO dehydrogenase maturation factor